MSQSSSTTSNSSSSSSRSPVRPAHPKLSHSLFAQAAAQPPTDSDEADPDRAGVCLTSTPTSTIPPGNSSSSSHQQQQQQRQQLDSSTPSDPPATTTTTTTDIAPSSSALASSSSSSTTVAADAGSRSSSARAPSSPNARSCDITVASGLHTDGTLNQHPASTTDAGRLPTFRVGVSEDRNKKCRRTMEDAHSFIYDYAGVPGQGYFAVFDGHAGKNSAEWCGAHFHEHLREHLERAGADRRPVPDLLNETFLAVDRELSALAEVERTHSGCTAVVAFLRIEEGSDAPGGPAAPSTTDDDGGESARPAAAAENGSRSSGAQGVEVAVDEDDNDDEGRKEGKLAKVKGVLGKLTGSAPSTSSSAGEAPSSSGLAKTPSSGLMGALRSSSSSAAAAQSKATTANSTSRPPVIRPSQAKRVLYTANAGDARAVLCRRGKAVRLTYDHKGSDQQEAKRITDAGGFVMNNRVNGVLAVTRALGDASVKEFVVGSPYTTETTLDAGDEFLIVACDGLWDVAEDQDAVDLVREIEDPQEASAALLKHALESFSTDNLSVLVVRLAPKASA